MEVERNNRIVSMRRVGWRRVWTCLLAVAVLSAIVLGPWGLLSYVAGFLKSSSLAFLLVLVGLVGWVALLLVACVYSVRDLRARHMRSAALWMSIAFGVVVAYVVQVVGKTPAPRQYFGYGLFRRLEIRTDIGAVQTWVESSDPRDCLSDPHSGGRGRHLDREEQPVILTHQNGVVYLELDAGGRPRMRLTWDESRAGRWGLVIGHRGMKTPPPDPNMYGEWRTELRPGVYFWYVER